MFESTVLLDGAVGTSLWEKTDNKVPVWRYNVENPRIVSELHEEYIRAGAQIILANTFGANGGAVSKTEYTVKQIVPTAIKLAKEAAAGRVKVAFSVGPLTGLLEPYGDITEEDATAIYNEMIDCGMSEKPDMILIQTFMDLEMLKLALGIAEKYDVPIFCAMSFDQTGHTMMGNSVKDMCKGLEGRRVSAIGLNCSIGPELALPVIESFREYTDLPLLFKPNAGKPTVVNGKTQTAMDADTFANDVFPAAKSGVKYIGGCCGTNAKYIEKLAKKLGRR